MNYYPFHIGDYASATRHLSWDEDAAYRRLLDVYYTTEKPLPSEMRAVCRLVLATTETQREAVAVVLDEFFDLTDEGWVNHRADIEIAAMRERQDKQRDKANRRWDKHRTEHGNAPAMPRHDDMDATASETDADAMPPTPTPTPTPTPKEKHTRSALAVRPDSVPDAVWQDFLAIRKAKRCPLTRTALAGLVAEAEKAGMPLADVLAMCCERGWQGFKADWVEQARVRAGPKSSRYASVIADLTGRSRKPEEFVDVESTEVRRIG